MRKTNYHTHTYRCMHAGGSDEEYVLAAIKGGYEEIGFSDHSPWRYDSDFVAHMRMSLSQFDDYNSSIMTLKEKYKDQISIKIGLECEYFPKYMKWLKQFVKEKQLDYIIFGNHYRESDELRIYYGNACIDDDELRNYVDDAIEGMKTGLYAYLCHPDLFMRSGRKFDDTTREQCYRLCEAAKKYQIPLEYNGAGLEFNMLHRVEEYPHHEFWKIAKEVGNTAIIGIDAHTPRALANPTYYKQALHNLETIGISLTDTIRFFEN